MNRLYYLLSKLAEEACEVNQAALEVIPSLQQKGLDFEHPTMLPLFEELNETLAVIEMLNEEYGFGYRPRWFAEQPPSFGRPCSRPESLLQLATTASQVAQMVLKAQQFGLESFRPGDSFTTNLRHCHRLLDAFGGDILEFCGQLSCSFLADQELIAAKKEKVNRFAKVSARLGVLAPPVDCE